MPFDADLQRLLDEINSEEDIDTFEGWEDDPDFDDYYN